MAICDLCQSEMLHKVSCTNARMVIVGRAHDPIRWGSERWQRRRRMPTAACGDCGTPPGGVHHHGCDMEECPRCGDQAISCGCPDLLDFPPVDWPQLEQRSVPQDR